MRRGGRKAARTRGQWGRGLREERACACWAGDTGPQVAGFLLFLTSAKLRSLSHSIPPRPLHTYSPRLV